MLYVVFTASGRLGYCPFQDKSAGKEARTLFLPFLNRRSCFVDTDGDGRFDASFSVFNKYGSLAAPSGDIASARPLPQPVPFERIDAELTPQPMLLAFILHGPKQPGLPDLQLELQRKGHGWEPLVYHGKGRQPKGRAVNAAVEVTSVSGDQAAVNVLIDRTTYLVGSSDGSLFTTDRLPFPG